MTPRKAALEVAAVGLPAVASALGWAPFPWSLPAALVACGLLPLRHLWPPLALIAGLPGLAGGLGWPPAIVALYALGRRASRPVAVWPWLVPPVLAAVVPVLLTQEMLWSDIVLTVAFVILYAGAPAALGLLINTRARLTESLRELHRARAAAASSAAAAARAEERGRIGREIHDSVGHHLTLIAVGAAALAASTSEPDTRSAAERLRGQAKQALAEMRAALFESTTATDLIALVEGARAAGVPVTLEDAAGELPPPVARAVYRVVQESLTNAARHAPGAPVNITLTRDAAELSVSVTNPVASGRSPSSTGTGLAGLAERTTAAGGRLSAGPSRDAGFEVRADFPLPAGTPESSLAPATNGGGAPADRDGH